MTDFRELACELLAALAWVNKHHPLPPDLKFDELEQRAAEAVKAPPDPLLPLIPESEFRKQQQAITQEKLPPLSADASPLVKYQRRLKERSSSIPGAFWY